MLCHWRPLRPCCAQDVDSHYNTVITLMSTMVKSSPIRRACYKRPLTTSSILRTRENPVSRRPHLFHELLPNENRPIRSSGLRVESTKRTGCRRPKFSWAMHVVDFLPGVNIAPPCLYSESVFRTEPLYESAPVDQKGTACGFASNTVDSVRKTPHSLCTSHRARNNPRSARELEPTYDAELHRTHPSDRPPR